MLKHLKVFCMWVPAKIHFSFLLLYLCFMFHLPKLNGSVLLCRLGKHWGMPKVINCLYRNLIHMLCSVVVIPRVASNPGFLTWQWGSIHWHCLSLLCVHTASSLLNESFLYVTAVGGLRWRSRLLQTRFEVKLKSQNWLDKQKNKIESAERKVAINRLKTATYFVPRVCGS